jgi:hypothetical protein
MTRFGAAAARFAERSCRFGTMRGHDFRIAGAAEQKRCDPAIRKKWVSRGAGKALEARP